MTYWELASNQGIYGYQRVLNFKMRCSDLRNSQHSARETAMSAVQFGISRCEPPYHSKLVLEMMEGLGGGV